MSITEQYFNQYNQFLEFLNKVRYLNMIYIDLNTMKKFNKIRAYEIFRKFNLISKTQFTIENVNGRDFQIECVNYLKPYICIDQENQVTGYGVSITKMYSSSNNLYEK